MQSILAAGAKMQPFTAAGTRIVYHHGTKIRLKLRLEIKNQTRNGNKTRKKNDRDPRPCEMQIFAPGLRFALSHGVQLLEKVRDRQCQVNCADQASAVRVQSSKTLSRAHARLQNLTSRVQRSYWSVSCWQTRAILPE